MKVTLIQLSLEDLQAVVGKEVERVLGPLLPSAQAEPKYIKIDHAAQKYGVSKSHLYTLSSQRAVTTRKVGRAVHFLVADLERHFDAKVKPSVADIDAKLKERGVFPSLDQKRRG